MTIHADAPVAPKQYAQHVAYEFIKDSGYGQVRYEIMYGKIINKLMQLPTDDIVRASAIIEQMTLEGISAKYLRSALGAGKLIEAVSIIERVVLPNLSDLASGDHGIDGALLAIKDIEGLEPFTVPEGKEVLALAIMKLECALDRFEVIGNASELRAFVAANTEKIEAVISAVESRRTVNAEEIASMVSAGVLADGAI